MFNVCPQCGEYRADKTISFSEETTESVALCPICGFRQKFLRLPLFILTGASGTGKTTICLKLAEKTKTVVVLESDILWRAEFDQPETDYRDYRETWLRLCKSIAQAGKPVVLCGAGVPAQFERCVERRYFSEIYYLALTCDGAMLAERLKNRPAWRNSGTEENIRQHVEFNKWLKNNARTANPPFDLLDTTNLSIEKSVEAVGQWIGGHLR